MKINTQNFDSVGEYVAAMADRSRRAPQGTHESHDERGRRDFFWTNSFDEAVELQRKGWADGAARVAKHREGFDAFIQAAKQAKTKQFAWDVTGDYVDVGRYLTGEPECFGSELDSGESLSSRVVSIRLNNCVSAAVSAETICARGLAVLVAVDLLEACGIRCEVVVGTATKRGDTLVESNVTVKRPGEQADPDSIAFSIAHPAFFRRFGFRFMELGGHSPSGCHPCPMSDLGSRPGVIEIDEILSGVRLDNAAMRKNVLQIAEKCGLMFDADQIGELIEAASA